MTKLRGAGTEEVANSNYATPTTKLQLGSRKASELFSFVQIAVQTFVHIRVDSLDDTDCQVTYGLEILG